MAIRIKIYLNNPKQWCLKYCRKRGRNNGIISQTISDSKVNVKFQLMELVFQGVKSLFAGKLNTERSFQICPTQLLMNLKFFLKHHRMNTEPKQGLNAKCRLTEVSFLSPGSLDSPLQKRSRMREESEVLLNNLHRSCCLFFFFS